MLHTTNSYQRETKNVSEGEMRGRLDVLDVRLRAKKKTTFFNANLNAFSLGKTEKLNDQMKAFEKILKSRPIPLF